MPNEIEKKSVIIGMVGDSGVGKTTLSKGISTILGEENVAVICTDDYHMHSREERASNGVCPLDPAGNYMDIMEQHLKLLRKGQPILKPYYNHNTGNLDRPQYIAPKPYIIVEGLLGYTNKAMRDCYDVKAFIEPEEDLRIAWKMHRDKVKRGYTEEQVLADLKKREFYSESYIRTQSMYADIIVKLMGYDKSKGVGEQNLGVSNILRPTLPHPNLNDKINELGDSIDFHLIRDKDNKPVDDLEVNPNVSEQDFHRLEEILWSGIDMNIDDIKQRAKNHIDNRGTDFGLPTAVIHVMLAAQMVKASLDVRVI